MQKMFENDEPFEDWEDPDPTLVMVNPLRPWIEYEGKHILLDEKKAA